MSGPPQLGTHRVLCGAMDTQEKFSYEAALLLEILEEGLKTAEAQGKAFDASIARIRAEVGLTPAQERTLEKLTRRRKKCRKRIRRMRREASDLRARA